jgi:hypothetical protein
MRSEVKTNQEAFDLYLANNASASVERDRAGTGGRRAVAEMTARFPGGKTQYLQHWCNGPPAGYNRLTL